MKLKPFFLLIFLVCSIGLQAQIGGERAFEFLRIPNNARLAALGGVNFSSGWDDPAQALHNPALISNDFHNRLTIAHLSYFAIISNTSVGYFREFSRYGTWSFNVSYLNYGEIESYDQNGQLNGAFNVDEYVMSVGNAKQFGPFSMGAMLKFASSNLSFYQANALMMDFSALFKHPEKDLTAGFFVRNLGFLTKDYLDGLNSQLPLDVQLGISYKPEFMPFRFSLTARNLNRSEIVYYDAANNSLLSQDTEPGFSEAVFRRLVLGTELLLSPNFQLRMGYNHLIRQELKNQSGVNGGVGFSFGLMFRSKRFEFAFSRASYHTAGGSNTFQVNVDLNGLMKKKTND